MNDEGLQTLFCEIEAILNNRPISVVSSNPSDLDALTPNHLLVLRPGERTPPGIFDKKDIFVRRKWRQVQYCADVFWKRWVKEYLPLLQERQKWNSPQRNVRVNDVVLIADDSPSNSWNLGRVLSVVQDQKGFVRRVEVKTKAGTLRRPIGKLCLILEMDDA